ncbi:MAG: hypothetical protein WCK82_08340 [Bacteroidota bacterium]
MHDIQRKQEEREASLCDWALLQGYTVTRLPLLVVRVLRLFGGPMERLKTIGEIIREREEKLHKAKLLLNLREVLEVTKFPPSSSSSSDHTLMRFLQKIGVLSDISPMRFMSFKHYVGGSLVWVSEITPGRLYYQVSASMVTDDCCYKVAVDCTKTVNPEPELSRVGQETRFHVLHASKKKRIFPHEVAEFLIKTLKKYPPLWGFKYER